MTTLADANCQALRQRFEGRQAIYIEAGVTIVEVSDIRCRPASRHISAAVVEVAGCPVTGGRFHPPAETARRWRISAGVLTACSDHTWSMGYGGWSMFFAADIVAGLHQLASAWAPELDAQQRYGAALNFLMDRHAYVPSERVFPEE